MSYESVKGYGPLDFTMTSEDVRAAVKKAGWKLTEDSVESWTAQTPDGEATLSFRTADHVLPGASILEVRDFEKRPHKRILSHIAWYRSGISEKEARARFAALREKYGEPGASKDSEDSGYTNQTRWDWDNRNTQTELMIGKNRASGQWHLWESVRDKLFEAH